MQKGYYGDAQPYWEAPIKLVDNRYETIDFPFQPVDGLDHTGPFKFKSETLMDLDGYFTYIRSLSAYQTAKEKGVELLTDDLVKDFTAAWNEDGKPEKVVSFPTYLKIGRVGN